MKKKSIFLTGALLFFIVSAFSQELYAPRNVKQAYQNHTRDLSGNPGQNYWQNHATYNISLKVSPPNRTVYGQEKIVYTNNSPDTLRRLNFKLYMNQHKPTAARLRPTTENYLTSGTHIDSYQENGVSVKWNSAGDATNKFVKLNQPLLPGASVTLTIKWHYKLSKRSGREGVIKKNTFYLAYFYPRVAVYDDYVGWDRMVFTGSQEFYNDFNDYTFQVTVPENYIVWATGTLQNPNEVLQPHYAQLLKKSMTSDQVIHIATPKDLRKQEITQQKTNTWKWKAHNVTDVALAISNEYRWDAGSVVVDAETGRRASVQAAYDSVSIDFEKMVQYGKHALKWFSNNLPGVPYPYPKMTVVRGFADMEYPMMVNDGSTPKRPNFTRFVAEHEIAHTYFPFYMGINETRFGFMDEGWATTFEYLIGINDMGREAETQLYKGFRVRRWVKNPNFSSDLPIIIPTNMLAGSAMGNNEYGKASLGYLAVKDLLGDKVFKKALQGYIARWHGKHPIPWDFFYSFNDISGKNLNWFWKSWFFSFNYIDIGIEKVETNQNGIAVTLKNVGGLPAPVNVVATLADGSTQTFHQTPIIWKEGTTTTVELKGVKNVKRIELEGDIFMDANLTNNTWKK